MPSVMTKILLGWMDEAEAMATLVRENTAPLTGKAALDLWHEYQAKVAALAPRPCAPPNYIAGRSKREEFAEHHLMQKHAKNRILVLGAVLMDDPGKLVAHQLTVVIPQSERYLADMKDPKKRLHLCFGRGMDDGVVIPRARREGDNLIKPVPNAEYFVTQSTQDDFDVKAGNRHIAVKEFNGRMLLWAGYHRVHSSMYRNRPDEAVLPLFAVLESDTVDGFFSVGSKAPFKRDTVCGLAPPLMSDFFDDSLCIQLPLRKRRVEMRVNLVTRSWDRVWVDAE
jgi:hypothetical protein